MSIRRLKLIRKKLSQRSEIQNLAEVIEAIDLLDEEIQSQDRSAYFQKYYKKNKETMANNHRAWKRRKAEEQDDITTSKKGIV